MPVKKGAAHRRTPKRVWDSPREPRPEGQEQLTNVRQREMRRRPRSDTDVKLGFSLNDF